MRGHGKCECESVTQVLRGAVVEGLLGDQGRHGGGRGEAAQVALAAFVEAMKASGFVADALKRHGIHGAAVAPAA